MNYPVFFCCFFQFVEEKNIVNDEGVIDSDIAELRGCCDFVFV